MEINADIFDPRDPDVRRQTRVQRAQQHAGRMAACHPGARNLRERVDSSISTTRAVNGDRPFLQSRESRFQQSLDRHSFCLPLPADEPGSVVTDRQLQGAEHGRNDCRSAFGVSLTRHAIPV